jgi:hypothetical protein
MVVWQVVIGCEPHAVSVPIAHAVEVTVVACARASATSTVATVNSNANTPNAARGMVIIMTNLGIYP